MAASGEGGDGVCGVTKLSGSHISGLSNNHVGILWRIFLTTGFIPTQPSTRSLVCSRAASRLESLPTHPTSADPREGCQGKPRKKSPGVELTPCCSLG